jgi:hypothetical protein
VRVSPFETALRAGGTVAVADGAGTPVELLAPLSRAAAAVDDVTLLLGWSPVPLDGLDLSAFARPLTLMSGYQCRRPVDTGRLGYVPARLGSWPTLVADVFRPDLLVASVVRCDDGFRFPSESAWLPSVVDQGARVLAVEIAGPNCVAGPPLPSERVEVVARADRPSATVAWSEPGDVQRRLGERVAALLPAGARLQYPPGAVGRAVVDAVHAPVAVDTGIITDSALDLHRRGLLLGLPTGAYVAGGPELYDWLDGCRVADRAERIHDPARLKAAPPLFAVNGALEIDLDGQVNIESTGGSAVGSIGGQPDYLAGAAASRGGLAIIAITTEFAGRPTLVERLSAPASSPAHDVDVVITETGIADLRGADRSERRRRLRRLWS